MRYVICTSFIYSFIHYFLQFLRLKHNLADKAFRKTKRYLPVIVKQVMKKKNWRQLMSLVIHILMKLKNANTLSKKMY